MIFSTSCAFDDSTPKTPTSTDSELPNVSDNDLDNPENGAKKSFRKLENFTLPPKKWKILIFLIMKPPPKFF